jgi:hypothetical protein
MFATIISAQDALKERSENEHTYATPQHDTDEKISQTFAEIHIVGDIIGTSGFTYDILKVYPVVGTGIQIESDTLRRYDVRGLSYPFLIYETTKELGRFLMSPKKLIVLILPFSSISSTFITGTLRPAIANLILSNVFILISNPHKFFRILE